MSNPRDEGPDDGPYYGDEYPPTEPRPSLGQQLPPWDSLEPPGGRSSGSRQDFSDPQGSGGSRGPGDQQGPAGPQRPDEPQRPDTPPRSDEPPWGSGDRRGGGGQSGFREQPGPSEQAGFGGRPGYGAQNGFGGQQGHGSQPRYGGQPGYRDQQEWGRQQDYAAQGGYGGQPGFGGQQAYSGQGGYGGQPGSGQQGQPGGGYPGQPGYGNYATSRVYGAPRGPQEDPGAGGPDGTDGRRRGGGRKRVIIITSAAAALVVAAAAVVFVVTRPSGPGGPIKGFAVTGSSPGQDAQQIATAFLTQWEHGNFATAASYTDDAPAAQAALASYGKYLGLTKMTAVYQSDTAAKASPGASASAAAGPSAAASASAAAATPHESVTFAVHDAVSAPYLGKRLSSSWDYQSKLVAYQVVNSPGWFISWQPDLLAANLTPTTHLATVPVPPKVGQVTDGNGGLLTSYKDPGLNNVARLLSQDAPPGQGGSAGLDVEIQNAKGVAVPYEQATLIKENDIPTLATTISPQAESAARSAVAMNKKSQMVVIQPSTGDILAVANNYGFNDFALTGAVAPGSTMKIITSTALFNEGTLTPNSQVACPKTFTVQGITYHNDNNATEPAGTPFWNDFAQSCNNAFTTQWSHLNGSYSLAATAKSYYGLNQSWGIGIPGVTASYFNAPTGASGAELAQEAFGEGQLTASPLAMASVAATVDEGVFKQPILLNNTKQVTATALPASTDAGLKQEMRAVVTSGTAANLGFGSDVYAKTGTADIVGQEKPNSWFVAFAPDKDVAVACLVLDAGYGAQIAAPEVLKVLKAY